MAASYTEEKLRILVMGSGAIGAYFGARLQQAGEEVVFGARGENLRALNARSLLVESPKGDLSLKVKATDKPREFAPYELVLLTVKSFDTEGAAALLDGCLAPDGVILTLQNGVENEARLAMIFGRERVMGGNARAGVELVAPGHAVHVSNGFIEFGELDGSRTARAERLAEVFRRAGIFGSIIDDLTTARWYKLLWNATFNTITTLCRRRVGAVVGDPQGLALVRSVLDEIAAVARAEGARIGAAEVETLLTRTQERLKDVRTSTLQDLDRERRLEYDALTGAVLRAADRHGFEIPLTRGLHTLIKLLDERPREAR